MLASAVESLPTKIPLHPFLATCNYTLSMSPQSTFPEKREFDVQTIYRDHI
jgi:hypothetical protein